MNSFLNYRQWCQQQILKEHTMQETKTAAEGNSATAKKHQSFTVGGDDSIHGPETRQEKFLKCAHGINEPLEVVVDGALVTCPCECRDGEPVYLTDHLAEMLEVANSHTGDTKFEGFICDARQVQEVHVWGQLYTEHDIITSQTVTVPCKDLRDIKTAILGALQYTSIGGAAESCISKALEKHITRHEGQKIPEAPELTDAMKAAKAIKQAMPDDCYAVSVTISHRSHSRDRHELSVSVHGPDYFYQATLWDLPHHPDIHDLKRCLSIALKANLTPVKVKRTTPIHRRYIIAAMNALDALGNDK
jgi:hypothetical protein